MKLYIRYIVSVKCRVALQQKLKELGIPFRFEEPGIVELYDLGDEKEYLRITNELVCTGTPVLNYSDRQCFEKTLSIIDQLILDPEIDSIEEHEAIISKETKTSFEYISDLFVEVKGITMEHYINEQRIERAKVLLTQTNKTIQNIADELHYKSPEELEKQLRAQTGLSPAFFVNMREKRNRLNQAQYPPITDMNEAVYQAHGKSPVQSRRKRTT